MTEITITEDRLTSLHGKVAVITGGSSGIGLATVELLSKLGASVVSGDLSDPPKKPIANHSFKRTDVSKWTDLVALFKHAKELHGRIDHVFANAGIQPRADYMGEEFDSNGELKEPSQLTFDVNLRGMINTSYLGLYHMRHQQPQGGSIVCTGSASSIQRFEATDYTSTKHGVLGWMRGIVPVLEERKLPIRVNTIAPSWTSTPIMGQLRHYLGGDQMQTPDDVAKSVALLMADGSRQGQLIYSFTGRFKEIEESVLLPAVERVGDTTVEAAGVVMLKLKEEYAKKAQGANGVKQ